MKSLLADKEDVRRLIYEETGTTPAVRAVALGSSYCFMNVASRGRVIGPLMKSVFDATISWQTIHDWLKDPLYEQADNSYPHPSSGDAAAM